MGVGYCAGAKSETRSCSQRQLRDNGNMACQRRNRRLIVRRTVVAAGVLAIGALAQHGPAGAQQTVVVGGSGLPPVEVNLGALESLGAPPGPAILLDPPGRMPRSDFLAGKIPQPASQPSAAFTAPLAPPKPAPAAIAQPAPKPSTSQPLLLAEPTLAPAPQPAVTAEPIPAPEPVPAPEPAVAAAEPAPAPAVEAVPPPEPEAEVAALPPAEAMAKTAPPDMLRIEYSGDAANLPGGARDQLVTLAKRLLQDESLRAEVKAYASGSSGSASAARRLSLSRALAVRALLIEEGVRSTRIDVRALGNRSEEGPPERVDVLLVNR